MSKYAKSAITRREFVKSAAVLGATASVVGGAVSFPAPAISAGLTPVNFSMNWLPSGGSNYLFTGKPFWRMRGLNVPIVRGYGSVATAQAVAAGKIDIAMCSTGTAIFQIMKGLDLTSLGIVGYDSTMGVAAKDGGPIKSPKDLEGRKLGVVPTSGEAPFIPAFMKLAQVDESKVNKIALDAKVVEQALLRGQVDAITMFGISSLPVFVVHKFPVKMWLYSSVGLQFYAEAFVTRPEFLEKNEALCADFMGGLLDCVKFWLVNPEESLQLHMEEVPELKATSTGVEFAQLGMEIGQTVMLGDEAENHGLGYGSLESINKQIKAITTFTEPPPNPRVFEAKDIHSNKYIGDVTLTKSQWDEVRSNNRDMARIMGKA